ncbi:MAG TPA: TatD family deoxyribonuclease [Gammaproteobacteria bacterium]|nr:putative deoxyribonuclease YcfH [bacterium BMS3Abin11]GMT41114.1 MAG: deoxyribonuclease [bacterium]HDH17031.1 TatD family deoxyribonuclease [Gammaproteobacteria bacterium]
MLVDSHCHINFDPLSEDTDGVIQRAYDMGVDHMLCVSVNMEDFPQVLTLAKEHDFIFASVGVHPNHDEGKEPTAEELIVHAQDPYVVAIGETGLDYFRCSGDMTWQKERFVRHIHAGIESDKPLIIHSREAAADTMDILVAEEARDCGGVMHCFGEGWATAKKALDIGFYISFSGILTFKNAEDMRKVAKKVPLDRVLVETDSPYLAPVPMRGKINEPAFTSYVADVLAEVKGVSKEEISMITTDNFFNLFQTAQRREVP